MVDVTSFLTRRGDEDGRALPKESVLVCNVIGVRTETFVVMMRALRSIPE